MSRKLTSLSESLAARVIRTLVGLPSEVGIDVIFLSLSRREYLAANVAFVVVRAEMKLLDVTE